MGRTVSRTVTVGLVECQEVKIMQLGLPRSPQALRCVERFSSVAEVTSQLVINGKIPSPKKYFEIVERSVLLATYILCK